MKLARNTKCKNAVLIIGSCNDDKTIRDFGLKSPGSASRNRIIRLSLALASFGATCTIVSPYATLSMPLRMPFWRHRRLRVEQGVEIESPCGISIPLVGWIFELFSTLLVVESVLQKRNIGYVIGYNYYPVVLLSLIYIKIRSTVSVVGDIEDICSKPYEAFREGDYVDFLRQIYGVMALNAAFRMYDGCIIPTRKFRKFFPKTIPDCVITGCFQVAEPDGEKQLEPIRVLFAGLLDEEHGVGVFSEALKLLVDQKQNYMRFLFYICGDGPGAADLIMSISSNTNAQYLGYVSKENYDKLVKKCAVGIALQDPFGKNRFRKTPSKAYELMCSGKCVICNEVGDLDLLPSTAKIGLKTFSAHELAEVLGGLSIQSANEVGKNAREFAKENWSYSAVGKKIEEFFYDIKNFKSDTKVI